METEPIVEQEATPDADQGETLIRIAKLPNGHIACFIQKDFTVPVAMILGALQQVGEQLVPLAIAEQNKKTIIQASESDLNQIKAKIPAPGKIIT